MCWVDMMERTRSSPALKCMTQRQAGGQSFLSWLFRTGGADLRVLPWTPNKRDPELVWLYICTCKKSRAFCYIMYCVNYLLLIGIFYKLLFWCKNNAKMSIICKYNWKIAQCDSEIFDLVILYWACDNRMFCAICLFDTMCSSRS